MLRNHSNAIPRYIIAFDTETRRNMIGEDVNRYGHRWRLGVAISCRLRGNEVCEVHRHRLLHPQAFWNLVHGFTAPNYTTWIVAHNALFDMIISEFPEQLEQSRFSIDWPRSVRKREDNNEDNAHCSSLCIIDSPPTIIALRDTQTQGRLVIVDSMNWFPVPLSQLGEACGMQKLPMPPLGGSNELWFDYCERDAEIVLRTFTNLISFVKASQLGMFRYTASSQAMAAFRHRFSRTDIFFHDNIDIKKLERRSYFGGRTEVFRVGEIDRTVWQLDVNSLFPSVMRTNRFPKKLIRFELRDGLLPLMPAIDYSASIADVELFTIEPIFPTRFDGKVVYPVGSFITTLAGPELELARKKQCIRAVGSWAEYETDTLFDYWVETLWAMRRQFAEDGNLLYEQFTKRLLNSLYGKFGQRSPKWVNQSDCIASLPWSTWSEVDRATHETLSYRSIGWQVQKSSEREEIDGTFPAISSFVTAYARLRMNVLRRTAGRPNVYYQGVDSLIVTKEGLQRLDVTSELSNTELGKLRIQLTADSGKIWGQSDYQIGTKIAIAGRASLLEESELEIIQQRKFIADSMLFKSVAANEVEEHIVPWVRKHAATVGTVGANGWVEPLVLG